MKPYLSLVIPYYNAPEKLDRLLTSIKKSAHAPQYEVIVVDDGSVKTPNGRNNGYRLVTLLKNHGPAVARNRGVAVAKGKFIVFLDCDVELFSDTLANIADIYRKDPDIVALTGVWVRHQKSRAFFPNFKAMRDWSYWIHERDQSGYYFLFSTRIASIKKTVFQRLGGFNETYPAPLVEDIELTYRIARRYAIIFAQNVRVRHEFEDFWPIAKKYFWRTYYWSRLYETRKKFDPVATTVWETATALTGVGAVGMLMLTIASYIWAVGYAGYLLGVTIALALLHVFFLRRFLLFAWREKGVVFAVKSLLVGLVLYFFIAAGAIYYRIRKPR